MDYIETPVRNTIEKVREVDDEALDWTAEQVRPAVELAQKVNDSLETLDRPARKNF